MGNVLENNMYTHWNNFQHMDVFYNDTWQIIYKKMFKLINRYANCNSSILDVGCGSAVFHDYFKKHDYVNVQGIDFSLSMIDAARCRHPSYSYIVGDALNLPFQDDSFDMVVSVQVLRHVPIAVKMVEEMIRVVKPGGFCIVNELNGLDIQFRDILFSSKRKLDEAVVQYLIPVNLERMIRRYGVIVFNDWKSRFLLQPMYIVFKKSKVGEK